MLGLGGVFVCFVCFGLACWCLFTGCCDCCVVAACIVCCVVLFCLFVLCWGSGFASWFCVGFYVGSFGCGSWAVGGFFIVVWFLGLFGYFGVLVCCSLFCFVCYDLFVLAMFCVLFYFVFGLVVIIFFHDVC